MQASSTLRAKSSAFAEQDEFQKVYNLQGKRFSKVQGEGVKRFLVSQPTVTSLHWKLMACICLCRIAGTWAFNILSVIGQNVSEVISLSQLGTWKRLAKLQVQTSCRLASFSRWSITQNLTNISNHKLVPYQKHIPNQRKASDWVKHGETWWFHQKLPVVKLWKLKVWRFKIEALSLTLGTPSQQSREVACCSSQVLPKIHQTLLKWFPHSKYLISID